MTAQRALEMLASAEMYLRLMSPRDKQEFWGNADASEILDDCAMALIAADRLIELRISKANSHADKWLKGGQ